jgi:hypothetical protein
MSKNHVTNCPHFASVKGGHHVTKHIEEGGRHVTCEKPSTSKPGWTQNTRTDHTGKRMSQGRIVTADRSLGGQIVWVKLLCGRFMVVRIVKAPLLY